MNTKDIENIIINNLAERSFPIYLRNAEFESLYEMDVMGITSSGYINEYEIKVSRSDFKADFKKKHKHKSFEKRESSIGYNVYIKGTRTDEKYEVISLPNRFYYVCEVGLIKKNEVPEYAGLIYISSKDEIIEIKKAPLLHRLKANERIYKRISRILSQRSTFGCSYVSYKAKMNVNMVKKQ